MATPIAKRAYSIAEFGEAYNLGRVKTYELMKTGALGYRMIGRHRVIPVDAAEAWFAALPGQEVAA